ncbi:hypothetical protein ACPOLB_23485 [Rubrivivax sp. RP6-9]|uniref:hypothetical protein n=1 Tax=Rubrivivax sp. RP6-9 TaxID=3415750 RepID=UPI003CC53DA7
MNLRVTECETPFFSKKCPKCGGYVEQSNGLLQLRTTFRCVECHRDLKTEARWRGALGLLYALPAIEVGSWIQRAAAASLGSDAFAFKVVVAAVALGVGLPAILLVFRGIVYVPSPEQSKSTGALGE